MILANKRSQSLSNAMDQVLWTAEMRTVALQIEGAGRLAERTRVEVQIEVHGTLPENGIDMVEGNSQHNGPKDRLGGQRMRCRGIPLNVPLRTR